jgi:hypothetical protein
MGADSGALASFEGGCHCGALRFEYRTRLPPGAWSVRACECSFCRAHASITTSDPQGTIEFREVVAGALSRYRFGLRSADFLVCARCGVYVGVVMDTNGERWGIINTNALRRIPENMAQPEPRNYSEETLEQRIARRKRVWSRVSGAV